MKKKLKVLAALVACGATFAACEKSPAGSEVLSSDEKALKEVIDQYVPAVIYDIYGHLADETENLTQQIVALRDAKTLNQADIDKACATFIAAREYWEKSEAFLFGPASVFGIDPHIDSWPLDKDKLALSLSSSEMIARLLEHGGDAFDELGPASLGFHGIEFILFRDGHNRTAAALRGNETDPAFAGRTVSGHDELVFAAAVAEDLYNSCAQLQVSWNPDAPQARQKLIEELELNATVEGSEKTYGENLLSASQAGSTYATWQEAVAKTILRGSASIADEVANTKMGTAHYVNSEQYDADYIESPYSRRSFYDFRDNILSIQYSLYGAAGAEKPHAKSLLTFLENKGYNGVASLEQSLKGAMESLEKCIASGKSFVEDPTADCVEKAILAVNTLSGALEDAGDWIVKL